MPLKGLIAQAAPHVANRTLRQQTATPLEGLLLLRSDIPSPFEASMYDPVLCLILQGEKQVVTGERTFTFGEGELLLVSHDLPVRSGITKAPYLALIFKIDVATIRRLCDEASVSPNEKEPTHAARTYRADLPLMDALRRYLALASSPADVKALGPLIAKEIHYRLLTAPLGGMLRRLVRHDSSASAIASAIGRIRSDIRSPIVIPDLAQTVGMSPSAFHKHFKSITATTPLQYQKELRLLEARRLLTMGAATVTAATYEVGYESPSQFSREYTRKFGVPPSRDLRRATV